MSGANDANVRTAVVSGGGTGIGRAIAARLGALGWRVAIGGRRLEPLEETLPIVEQAGGRGFAHALDVTDAASIDRFFEAAEAALGPVDVLINNAGIGRPGPIDEVPPEQIANEIATKVTGSLWMARRAIRSMRPRHTGDILFMSSASADRPFPFQVTYSAANAAVEHAAKGLRVELEGSGIRVSALRIGDTGGTEFAFSGGPEVAERMVQSMTHWFRHALLRHTQLMTPEMVADAVAAMVTLPPTYQLEIASIAPVAPVGEMPATLEEFMAAAAAQTTLP